MQLSNILGKNSNNLLIDYYNKYFNIKLVQAQFKHLLWLLISATLTLRFDLNTMRNINKLENRCVIR